MGNKRGGSRLLVGFEIQEKDILRYLLIAGSSERIDRVGEVLNRSHSAECS